MRRTAFSYASSSFARSADEGTWGADGAAGEWNSLTWPTCEFAACMYTLIRYLQCAALLYTHHFFRLVGFELAEVEILDEVWERTPGRSIHKHDITSQHDPPFDLIVEVANVRWAADLWEHQRAGRKEQASGSIVVVVVVVVVCCFQHTLIVVAARRAAIIMAGCRFGIGGRRSLDLADSRERIVQESIHSNLTIAIKHARYHCYIPQSCRPQASSR